MFSLIWCLLIFLVSIAMCNSNLNISDESVDTSVDEDSSRNDTEVKQPIRNKTSKMEGFVVGGEVTKIDFHPHSVFLAIYCMASRDNYWICGSSVINQRILLTAAHCLDGCVRNFRIDACAGSSNIDQVNVLRKVRRFIMHEQYDSKTDYCDIAIAMVNGDLPLGNKIRRVIIKRSFPPGSKGQVAGWGVVTDQYHDSPWLKQVSQVVRPASACGHLRLLSGMMCASSGSPKEYPAVGDSGSALITTGFQQIGIVSFKSKSRALDMIVYTNVSYFYHWLTAKTYQLFCTRNDRLKASGRSNTSVIDIDE